MDWIMYTTEYKKCKIHNFDDGNHSYQKYENKWYIISINNKGKVRLQNMKDKSIIIYSISEWKTTRCLE